MGQDDSQVLIEVGAKDGASGVLTGAFSRIDSHFKRVMSRANEANASISRFSTGMLGFNEKLEKFAKKNMLGGGLLGGGLLSQLPLGQLAVGGILTGIVKNFASLEDAMVDVGTAIENLTKGQVESLKKKIMEVGEEFPVSNVDVSKTAATMGRMGYDYNAIMDNLREVVMLDLASSTNSPNDTANSTISVMQSLDKSTDQLAKVTDQMMATQNFFGDRSNIRNLGTAFVKVGTDIKDKQIPDTEALAILGATMQSGFSPEESSTIFSAMIRDIETKAIKPFKKGGKIDPKLQAFLGSDMKFNSILEFVDEMARRNIDFRTVFQDESIRGARLITQRRDKITEFMNQKIGSSAPGMPDRSAGSVQSKYEARKNTFSFKFKEFMGSLENLGNALAESGIMDAVNEVIKDLTIMVQKAKDIDPETLKMIVKGFLITLGSGTLLAGIGNMIIGITALGAVLLPLAPLIFSIEGAVVAASLAFGALATSLDDIIPDMRQKMKDIGEAILKDVLSVFNIDYQTDADRRDSLFRGVAEMLRRDDEAQQSRVMLEVKMPPQMSVGRASSDPLTTLVLGGM